MEILYSYIRAKQNEQTAEESSLEEQIRKAENKAKAMSMQCEIIQDTGKSASNESIEARPALAGLIRKVKEGRVTKIWVMDITRLARNPIAKAKILTILKENNVVLYEGYTEYNYEDPSNIMLYKVMSAVTEYDAELRVSRFRNGRMERLRQGCYLGPIPPYGFKKNEEKHLIEDPEESKVVKMMVDLYLNKQMGTNKIASRLNELGIPTKSENVLKKGYAKNGWNPGTVLSLFKNTALKGVLRYKNEDGEYEESKCQAILSEELWDRVQYRTSLNKISKKKEDKYFYLLKGLLTCGSCGNNMHGRVKINRSEFTYRCAEKRGDIKKEHRCSSRGINIFKLNDHIFNAFKQTDYFNDVEYSVLNNDSLQAEIEELDQMIAELIGKINELKKDLDRGVSLLIKGVLTEDEFGKEKHLVNSKILEQKNNLQNIEVRRDKLLNRESIHSKQKGISRSMIKDSAAWEDKYKELRKVFEDASHSELNILRETLRKYINRISITWNPQKKTHTVMVEFNFDVTATEELDLKRLK